MHEIRPKPGEKAARIEIPDSDRRAVRIYAFWHFGELLIQIPLLGLELIEAQPGAEHPTWIRCPVEIYPMGLLVPVGAPRLLRVVNEVVDVEKPPRCLRS